MASVGRCSSTIISSRACLRCCIIRVVQIYPEHVTYDTPGAGLSACLYCWLLVLFVARWFDALSEGKARYYCWLSAFYKALHHHSQECGKECDFE